MTEKNADTEGDDLEICVYVRVGTSNLIATRTFQHIFSQRRGNYQRH